MDRNPSRVFLSYSAENQDFVESLARRLQGDARLSFWFAPWHSIPGVPIQEQMEDALVAAQSCAVFVSGAGRIQGWQNEQMRTAIQTHVEDEAGYRVFPVLVPGAGRPSRRDLPRFLRRYEMVEFQSLDDEHAFKRLLAGILGIPPIDVEGYVQAEVSKVRLPPSPSGRFEHGHALVIGVADYPRIPPFLDAVLNDAEDLHDLLIDPTICGYPAEQVTLLTDNQATGGGIRSALDDLAVRTGPDDTAVVFFSGHGAHDPTAGDGHEYLLPYDCDPSDLPGTAIPGVDMTGMLSKIRAGRLLVLFNSCHSGGVGAPRALGMGIESGLSEEYYEILAQGTGRIVMASSRPDEVSWVLPGMRNSLFTHYLLEALHGRCKTLGDGYVRVFDLFRHIANYVPTKANQHPIFKTSAMEQDFVVGLTR